VSVCLIPYILQREKEEWCVSRTQSVVCESHELNEWCVCHELQVPLLRKCLIPYMLRREKEEVEKLIPPKEEIIVEVEMSQLQRTTYKSILTKNFAWLSGGAAKGSQVPALRNVEMELRKCCNHPFLIDGVQDEVLRHSTSSDWLQGLVYHSGKMVLLDKILPKLRQEGHKVLIFSQFVRVLDVLERYVKAKGFPFERIDGRIRGNLRQSAIDRYQECGHSNQHRFVFLICTKAGGMGINLTSADTVIIFDSDWNPQNDLQAQARCHRIGQTRPVKIYRFITSKTYERRMFERASQKQGLEQAVIRGQHSSGPKKSSKEEKLELERLLRHGAYDLFQDGEAESQKFNEEDIESILAARSTKIEHENKSSANLMSTASFVPASAGTGAEVDYNDPDFWAKLMPAAVHQRATHVDERVKEEEDVANGRRRKTVERLGFDGSAVGDKIGGDSGGSGNDSGSGYDSGARTGGHKRLAARSDKFTGPQWGVGELKAAKKKLLDFGYGRWRDIHTALAKVIKGVNEADIQHFGFEFLKATAKISNADVRHTELIAQVSSGDMPKNATLHMSNERMLEACALKSEKSSGECVRKLLQLALLRAAVKRGDSDFGLREFAPSLPMVGWASKHDVTLVRAIYTHGVEAAASAVVADDSCVVADLVKRTLLNESPATRETRLLELTTKISKRAPECLRRLPGGLGKGGGSKKSKAVSSRVLMGIGEKREKDREKEREKRKRPASIGVSDGELSDFQDSKRPRSGGLKWEPIMFTDTALQTNVELVNPGKYIPRGVAFRPFDKFKYSVGYCSSLTWHGIKWRCSVEEKEDVPVFKVISHDGRIGPFSSQVSASEVWRIVAATMTDTVTHSEMADIDGIAMFGFSLTKKAVKSWIKKLKKGGHAAPSRSKSPVQIGGAGEGGALASGGKVVGRSSLVLPISIKIPRKVDAK